MIMLDSNVVIELMNGRHSLVRERYRATKSANLRMISVSSIVIFELQYGIAKSTKQARNAEHLRSFLAGTIEVLSFDDEDATFAGQIRATLEAKGTPIGSWDVMIAGHALRHGATLVTANVREFSRVDGLKLENWAAP
jgi:tRNA(fMet)-specific endonuclease VapC